jgi:Ca2+-binding RTX toxin-like protein
MIGTDANDRLLGTPHRDVIVGGAGDDYIAGRGHDDLICGRGGDDFLSGGQGDDRLATGPGNNGLSGDAGDDVLQGGSGPDDNANYVESPRAVFASIEGGFARGQGHDKIRSGVDELFGSLAYGDTLIGDARGQLLAGFGGDDRISGGGGDDLVAGGSGDDRINGGPGAYDVLDDLEFGGSGSEHALHLDLSRGVATGHGRDRLRQVEGTYGSVGNDRLVGSSHSDVLVGDAGDDTISGGAGPDVVEGDAGLDSLDGGSGTDYASAYGSPTPVTIDLAAETIMGPKPSIDTDSLRGIEDAQGSTFDDTISGDDGSNALRGDLGGDTISGAAGDDILIGGCGAAPSPHFFYEDVFDCSTAGHPDWLDGGPGDDQCGDAKAQTGCEATVSPRSLAAALRARATLR